MDERMVELVLRAVEQLPPGRVASYGDLAGLVGCGPRYVGAIMKRYGHDVAWWRVTNAAGDLPAGLRAEAFSRWRAEGIEPKGNGRGCRIADYRVDLVALDGRWRRAAADVLAEDDDAG